MFHKRFWHFIGINIYSDEEFAAAFAKVDKDNSGFLTSNEVEDLLFETYGYPALEEEVKLFMDYFDSNHDGKISFDEFKTSLSNMRKDLGKKDDAGVEYKSYTKMMDDRYKNRRMGNELEEKYKVPLTFNQSIGFKI